MSQVTEQSVRFQTALASIKLIQASAVLDLTEDDFDFLTSNKVWIRSEERFSRNAETDLVCRLLLEKKNIDQTVCTRTSDSAPSSSARPPLSLSSSSVDAPDRVRA